MTDLIDDATADLYLTEIDKVTGDDRLKMANALEKYADGLAEKRRQQTDEHFSKLFTDEAYFEQEKQANAAVQESLDPDQTAKSAAIGAWLEHHNGRPIDPMSYQVERDAFAMANYGKKNLDDNQLFDFISGEYNTQKKKTEAINDLQMQAVGKAIADSQLGQTRPFVDGMTEVFNQWQQKYPELVDGKNDAAFLSQGYKLYYDTINDLDTVRPQASKALSTLTSFTQGNATDEDMQSLANDFVGAPPEDRQKIYKYVTLAAQAGQIDRAGIEQFAVNMGQAFTRGFDFVPQGTLQMQEAGVNNWLESIRNGTQIWVPADGDLTKAVVGNAPAGAESDAWRQATVPEAETLIQSGQNVRESFKVVRELRNVAKTGVDPIRPVLEENSFWGTAERGAYGLAGSIPLMGATAVNPFLGVLAYQATEYDRIMLENPDVDPQFAQGLALVEGAANAAIDRVQLSSISGRLPMFGRYLDRIASDGVRRTVKIGANVVEQNLQEGAQDLIAPVLETAVASLREDMPDKDFTKLMDDWSGQRAETFFATLPLALIGGGVATYRDIKNPSAELNATKLRMAGFGQDQVTFIQRAENPEEYDARIKMEWEKRTPENIKAGEQEVLNTIEKARTPGELDARMQRVTAPDGSEDIAVTSPDGKELLRTKSEQAALEAVRQHNEAQLINERNAVSDMVDYFRAQDPANVATIEAPRTVQQELDRLTEAGDSKGIANLNERIRFAGIPEGSDLTTYNILGEANVETTAEGVFRGVIKLRENSRPEDAFEEINHVFVRKALAEGRTDLDSLRGWLNQTSEATGEIYATETETDIIENIAKVGMDYAAGRIEETSLPASFVDYIKRMLQVFKETMARAIKLKDAFATGKIDSNFESFLADSVGLNQQARVDTASNRVSKDIITDNGQMLMDFSIGSRTSAVSTDTPAIRASNATITGPANYSIGAFHGTPHKVDKFSLDKIGTGEGAQAYGWGLYFAENRGVGEQYRNALAQKNTAERFAKNNRIQAAVQKLDSARLSSDAVAIKTASRELDQLSLDLENELSNTGNLYTVDLDVEPEDLLDWDKPFSEQSPKVQAALKAVQSDHPLWKDTISGKNGKPVGGAIYKTLTATWPDAEFARDGIDPKKKASEALLAAGIPGIRYLDGGSRSDGEGTYNYVAFDENLIRITEENGNRIPASEALAHPVSTDTNYSIGKKQDADYFAAVERGDMETAQRMVDEAAKASGLPILDDSASEAYRARRTPPPQKTIKGYKLFTTKPNRNGELFPLFVGANESVPQGVWLDAIEGRAAAPSKTGKPQVKSKLGPLAFRPGWHAGDLPLATHIGIKNAEGKVSARRANEVWAEVELANDTDYQPEADASKTRDLRSMPKDGAYRFKTNPNMTGNWIISGSMKVNRIMSQQEVNSILEQNNVTPMPWEGGVLDLQRMGLSTEESVNTLKLSDPVTYDDAGNVIPLSQRFNPKSPNINYSIASVEHFKNDKRFDKLVKDGRVVIGHDIEEFKGMHILLHSPDNAFAGTIKLTDGEEIEGKGGVYYPALYANKNYFWASTEATVMTTAKHLNEIGQKNGGKILMGLVSAPVEKLFSSTSMATGVVKFLNSLTSNPKAGLSKEDLNSMLVEASKVEFVKKGATPKKFSMTLAKGDGLEKNLSKVDALLEPTKSIFQVRKMFSESLADQLAKHLKTNPESSNYVAGILADAENKHAKSAIKRGTLSKASIMQGLGNLFTEPFLRDFQDHGNGKIYAVLEVDGMVDGVASKAHDSYPFTLVPRNKKSKVKLHVLNQAVDWQDVVGRETGEYTTPEERIFLMPTSGMSAKTLKVLGVRGGSKANPLNYSIASQSEIDRVNKALGGMNRGPDERLKVYQRAKQKFSKVMAWNSDELAAMADTGSDDSQIRRTQILQGLGELDGIMSVLPPEVRGRVGGYTKLAGIAPMDVFKDGVKISEVSGMRGALISAWMDQGLNIGQAGKKVDFPPGYTATENLSTKRADKAIADFFRDRIKKIDTELEKVLVREYTEAITKAVKQSRPKAGDNGVRKSTLGAETQKFADMVQRATLLDDEATPKRMAEIEAALANPDATAEDISALSEEWSILNTFGDLDNRSSETLAQGLDWLKGQLQMGREAWRIKEQARIDEQRARAAATIEWLGKGTAKKRFADKGLMQRIAEVGNNYLLDHASFEQFVTAMLPPEIAANFSERLRKADMAAQAAEIRDGKGILDAVREGAKAANMSAGDAMLWLKGDQKNAVAYLEGRKVKDERIAIDLAQKIVTGEADRSKLTDADVETLRNELAALPADTQKEYVTIKRVIFRGEDVKLDMSRAKAIQLLLSWSQPDVQIKMRKEGWTDESAADLKALVNDPVSRSVVSYLQSLYGKGAGIVNPVYSRMFGMTMPQVKNYAPTRFLNAKDSKDIGLDGSPTATGTTPSFAKSRVTHSAKIAPEDALTVAQGHIAQQAHWVHFAELAREFRALLSSPDVRESLKQTHGDAVLKSAELWADQLEQRGGNKARESAWLNNVIGTAISGKAVASLGFNLKTLAMQLENTIRFGLSLDMKQIASALSQPGNIIEDIQTVWESDAIQNRLQGGATAEARFLFSRYAGKPNFAAKIAEASMTPINWLDSAGTSISSAIVYRANLNDALDAGMPENLAKQAALNAASEAIYRFAQPVSFGQKSIIENNGNVFAKTFFLFMSDPRLKTAILADAARGLATGRGNASENIRRIVAVELMALVSHVISSAFKDTFSDDDDEEIWGIGGFAKAMLLAPFQGFFFAGSVAEVALSKLTGQGYFTSSQNPLLNTAESAIRAGSNLDDAFNFSDPDAMLKEWNNIFRSMAVTPTMAAPAVLLNMVKPVVGLYQNATTEE